MPEYPQPGAEQRSQQHFIIFDRFKGLNTQLARAGLPNDQLAWLENLQPLAENKLQVVPAAAPPAVSNLAGFVGLPFYAAMNNQDWLILFTIQGGGLYYNISTGASGQFAPDGTFSTAPDCTTWQAARILINDSVAGYCTWDGTLFVAAGGVSPNIEVTAGGANYSTPPPVSILVNGAAGVAAVLITTAGAFSTPAAGTVALTIDPPPPGGTQAVGTATLTGTAPNVTVASVTINTPGAGYTTPPSVTIATTGGTPPQLTAVLGAGGATAIAIVGPGGVVTDVELTNAGSGLNPGDTVTLVFGSTTGSGADIVVRPGSGGAPGAKGMSGAALSSISITDIGQFGSGAFNPGAGPGPSGTWPLTISAPPAGGTQAVASVSTISNPAGNTCNAIVISNPGAGYAVVPTVAWNDISHGAGVVRFPSFSAHMGVQQVQSPLTINSGGTAYPPSTNIPLLFQDGGGAPDATGFATTNASGVVISTTLQDGGTYALGSRPTITVAAGTGAAASAHAWPFVTPGTTLAVFQGRVFLGGGQLLQWSGTGATVGYNNSGYDDFLVADLAGALQITDADLVHAITALRSVNNYLWVVGDQSIKQIGSLFPSGAPPFQLLTLSSDQGTIWPKSCISYNRIFMFANPNGIFGVFGSTVQKISDDLDGIFQRANFTRQVQGAVVDLNSKHNAVFLLRYDDPQAGTRSLLPVFDGKRWWLGNQGPGLVAIATAPMFATDVNELWGSVTGTDVTRLFADPATAVPFKLSTALAHSDNPVQGKRVIRAGFTASSSGGGSAIVAMAIDTDDDSIANTMVINGGLALTGGANDATNEPISGVGIYLGMTISGVRAGLTMHNLIVEYQEKALWGLRSAVVTTPPGLPVVVDPQGNVYVDQNNNIYAVGA